MELACLIAMMRALWTADTWIPMYSGQQRKRGQRSEVLTEAMQQRICLACSSVALTLQVAEGSEAIAVATVAPLELCDEQVSVAVCATHLVAIAAIAVLTLVLVKGGAGKHLGMRVGRVKVIGELRGHHILRHAARGSLQPRVHHGNTITLAIVGQVLGQSRLTRITVLVLHG